MAITKGILGCLKASNVAGGATGYTNIAQMNDLAATVGQKTFDSTVLTCVAQSYAQRMSSIKSVNYKASGFFDSVGDTTGQQIVLDNVASGAELWFQYWFETANWVKTRVEIDGFSIKTTPEGGIEVSITAQSTGVISYGTS
jgi:hypothetical protein